MTAKYPTGKVLTYYALFGGGIGGLTVSYTHLTLPTTPYV